MDETTKLELMTAQAQAQWIRGNLLVTALSQIETLYTLTNDPAFILQHVKEIARGALRADFDNPDAAGDFDEWLNDVISK
jgi:hypothetical protein